MTRKLKRLLALFLTLAMVLSLLSTGAWATETEPEPTAPEEVTEAVDPTKAEEITETEELPEVEVDETVTGAAMMALDPVSYLKWDDTEKQLAEQTGDDACQTYTVVSNQTTWGAADTDA